MGSSRYRGNLHIEAERRHQLNPEQQVLASALATAVQAAISRLPSDWQSVVLLNFVEEWTYQEVADLLGIPLGTVMSRLYRARRVLRQRLARYLADEAEHARPYTPMGKAPVTSLDGVRQSASRSKREAG
jgi:DNA-directed RNA polymerase specialized sigma24 family protein